MSAAAAATGAPEAMAKPTSAAASAGASLTPSAFFLFVLREGCGERWVGGWRYLARKKEFVKKKKTDLARFSLFAGFSLYLTSGHRDDGRRVRAECCFFVVFIVIMVVSVRCFGGG